MSYVVVCGLWRPACPPKRVRVSTEPWTLDKGIRKPREVLLTNSPRCRSLS